MSEDKDHTFSRGFVTHIGEESKALEIIKDKRTGSFAYNLRYHHDYSWLPVDDGTLYKDFESIPRTSYNVSFSVNYFWDKPDEQLNWGVGAGLTYRTIKSEVKLNGFYDTITNYTHPVLNTIDLYKEGHDLKQSLKYSSLGIPVTGHIKYGFSENTFLDVRAGIVTSLNFSGTVKQEGGTSTYKGYYEVVHNNNTIGKYLIEDVPEYGFTTNENITITGDESKIDLKSVSFSGIFGFTVSTKLTSTIPVYLDIGPYINFGLSPVIGTQSNGDDFILNDAGQAGNVFKRGVKGKVNTVGFTIGVRWYNQDPGNKNRITF